MDKYRDTYQEQLDSYTIISETQIDKIADRIIANKDRYVSLQTETGIPWYFIGALHYRESNLDFDTHLHNGDPLTARTRRVPKGYPKEGTPPFTWEESALDALKIKGLHEIETWDWNELAYQGERFNGFGYRAKNTPSPYLWSGTDIYKGGKYVRDHVFDRNTFDKQMGIIPIMERVIQKDKEKAPVKRHEVVNGSRKLTFLQRLRNAIVGLGASIGAADWFGMLEKAKQFATDNAGVLLLGGAATIWIIFKLVELWSLEDYKEGRYVPSKTKKADEVRSREEGI